MVAGGVTNFTNSLKVLADNITLVKNAMVALSGIALAKWVLPLLGLAGVPGAIAGGMAVLYANLDKTAKGVETLSERRGLGTNLRGRSGSVAAQRIGESTTGMNSLAAIRAFDKANNLSGGSAGGLTNKTLETLSGTGSGTKSTSGKTAAEEAWEKQIKLAQEAGKETMYAFQRWEKQELFKKEALDAVAESDRQGIEALKTIATDEATRSLEALKLQVDIGNISFEQYRDGLTQLKEQFDGMPEAVLLIDDAMKALDNSILASTRTLGSFVREAETALSDKLIALPDAISGAFAGAIAYGEDLGDTLKSLAKDIAYAIIKATILKAITGALGFSTGGVVGGGVSDWHDAGNSIKPFASGGIVNGRPRSSLLLVELALWEKRGQRQSCR